MIETILGIAAYTLTTEFVKNIYSNIASSVLYDATKPAFLDILKKKSLPVNQDIQKAVRKSYLLAAQEVVKFCIRNKKTVVQDELRALELLIDFFIKTELKKEFPTFHNAADEKIEYLNFTEIQADDLEQLKIQLQQGVIRELNDFLKKYITKSYCVAPCIVDCIENGWNENGKQFTFFGFMSDFFHEFIKTDARLNEIVKDKWLAEILTDVRDIKGVLEKHLENTTKNFLDIQGRLGEIISFLNPQPNLRYDFSDQEHQNKAVFRSRYLDFVGREEEMAMLKAFFESRKSFSWCLISGTGGSGKSRLAMELCYELNHSYNLYAGFIKTTELETSFWATWQPESITLVIIDYVASDYKKTLDVLEILYHRKNLNYPVRFILLEREATGEWWEKLTTKLSNEEIPKPFTAEPIALQALGAELLVNIIANCLDLANKPRPNTIEEWTKIIKSLLDIDPKGRPLFALFVGIALANGENLRDWTKEKLLENYIAREEEHFWQNSQYGNETIEKHKNLVALATMMGGLSQSEFVALLNKKLEFLPEPRKEWKPEIYEAICDISNDESQGKYYRALEPDILGEYFVMKRLETYKNSDFDQIISQQMIQLAWEIKPFLMAVFTLRFYQDFYNAPCRADLLRIDTQTNEDSLYWWSVLTIDISTINAQNKQIDFTIQLFEILSSVFTKSDRFLINQSGLAYNLVNQLGVEKRFEEAIAYYQKIVDLAQKHPLQKILIRQAEAAVNLTHNLGREKRFQVAIAYYQQIVDLAQKHPLQEILINQAKAAVNLTLYLGMDKRFQEAIAYYQKIVDLAQKHPLQEILTRQAEAAVNLTNYLGSEKRFEEAIAYYQKIIDLAQKHPIQEILVNHAEATFNLINYLGEEKRFEEAIAYYQKIVDLAQKHPLQGILLEQVKATFNLINHLGGEKRFEEAIVYYQKIVDLAQKHPLQEILIVQARAAVSLIYYLRREKQFKEAADYYQKIVDLAQKHPLQEILIWQAKAASGLVLEYANDNNIKQAFYIFLEKLYPFAQLNPMTDIWLEVAKSLGILLDNFADSLENKLRESLVKLLVDLLQANYQESSWQETMPALEGVLKKLGLVNDKTL